MEDRSRPGQAHRRADVQGLRAVAIVAVVACHAGVLLPGGFIGVDVFFVISGFVIGSLLLRRLDGEGTVALGAFYAARARRLLPLLAVVLLASLAVGVLVLNPYLSQELAFETAAAASVFLANLYLYRHSGYFDATSDAANPFLHLWSLSVEEQFYLVLPVLVLGAWRLGRRAGRDPRRTVAATVAVVAAASFVLGWALATERATLGLEAPGRFAFFSSLTRFWELAAGVVLALLPGARARIGAGAAGALGAVGAAALVAGAVLIDPLQPYPAAVALVPVLAAVALLVAGERSPAAGRALAVAPLRWIGDRSYGWYLWHWPLIVYARLLWPDAGWVAPLAALVALGLAAGTYAAFEDRVRHDRRIVGRRAAALASVCLLVPLVVALGLVRGARGGWGVEQPLDWFDTPTGRGVGCVLVNRDLPNAWRPDACTTPPPGGEPEGTVLVLGDFHADSVSTAVIDLAAERNWQVVEWARAGCPFTLVAPEHYPRCTEWQDDAFALVEELDPDVVVVANRSHWYTTDPDGGFGSAAAPLQERDGAVARSTDDALAAWERGLAATVERLEGRGAAVVVVGAAPDHRTGFPQPSLLRPDAVAPERRRAEVDEVHDPVVAVEQAVVDGAARAAHVDPVPIVCDDATCTTVRDGRWTYYDGFHLNNVGSRLLAPALDDAIDRALAGSG